MITAEEILDKNAMSVYEDVTNKYIINAMIDFAKMHVEEALKAAWAVEFNTLEEFNNCYPLDNIK